jgi:hypothetical protein
MENENERETVSRRRILDHIYKSVRNKNKLIQINRYYDVKISRQ